MHVVLVFSASKGTTTRHLGRERMVPHSSQRVTAGEEGLRATLCQAGKLPSHSVSWDPSVVEGMAGCICQIGIMVALVVV